MVTNVMVTWTTDGMVEARPRMLPAESWSTCFPRLSRPLALAIVDRLLGADQGGGAAALPASRSSARPALTRHADRGRGGVDLGRALAGESEAGQRRDRHRGDADQRCG